MPKLVSMLRVKDGILFVQKWLQNISPLVDEIVVVDNGSTDGTLEILQRHPKVVAIVRTEAFDEGRDKILGYKLARERHPDWVLWLDVDEIFEDRLTRKRLDKMMKSRLITRYFFRRFHFHRDYHHFEARLDKLIHTSYPDRVLWKEQRGAYFKNLRIHNGLIQGITGLAWVSNIRIKHLGGVDREYLSRKTSVYLAVDPALSAMYIDHRDQNVETWEWREYHESPLIVSVQNLLMWALFALRLVKDSLWKVLTGMRGIRNTLKV
jgi:glycosyltransferase involved in cell wall biosynthesis